MGGDARDEASRVESAAVEGTLLDDFGLSVSVEDVFGIPSGGLTKHDMERMVLKTPGTTPRTKLDCYTFRRRTPPRKTARRRGPPKRCAHLTRDSASAVSMTPA